MSFKYDNELSVIIFIFWRKCYEEQNMGAAVKGDFL